MSKSIKKIFFLTVAIIFFATPILALASGGVAGTPTIEIFKGIFGAATLTQIIIRIVQIFFALLGVIALAILSYAGFIWMTAAGDPAKVTKAKQMIYGAIIGLIIIFSAFAIASFVFNAFGPKGTVTEACSTSGEVQGCSVNGCAGQRQCSGEVWGGCIQTDFACPTYPFYDLKFANIFKFSDPSLPNWSGKSWGYKNYYSGVIALPKTDTLQISAFAHNSTVNGAISSLRLWEVSTTTELDFGPFSITDSGQYNINSKSYYFAWASTTWAASSGWPNSVATLRASVNNNTEKDYYSKSVKVRFWPQTCFNGVKDGGEKDIDCGGECPNCDGESCKRAELNTCDDSNCSSGICNNDCRCAVRSIITYVDPALDVNKDTNRLNIVASQVDDDISNGAVNNYITIFGRNFGQATGTVYFTPLIGATQTQAPLALCAKSWSNNQIVVMVPSTLNQSDITKETEVASSSLVNPLSVYNINVQPASSTIFSNSWGFQVNKIERPGICQMEPNHGIYPATTTITGYNFPTADPRDVVWTSGGEVKDGASNWSPYQVTDVVPENKIGRSGVRVYNGDVYSNYYIFQISAGDVGDPCGYDSAVCAQDLDTCRTDLNLACSQNCTCQPVSGQECTYNASSTLNQFKNCKIGGCDGKEYCNRNKNWSGVCTDIADGCVPFLGASSNNSIFSWSFFAKKTPASGRSCSSEVWNDGTCNLNGCLDNNLACDSEISADEFVEFYNPTTTTIDLTGWGIVYGEQSISTSGLLGYYKLDNNTANSAPGSTGSLVGSGTYSNDNCINYSCISLTTNHLAVNNPAVMGSTAGNFTWSVWFKPKNSNDAYAFTDLLRKGETSGTHQAIQLFWRNDTKELGFKWDGVRISKGNFEKEKWYQVAVSFDSATNLVILYVDGSEIARKVMASGQKYTDQEIVIGGYSPESGASFDSILIYNRTLSQAEIKNLYSYRGRSLSGSLAPGKAVSVYGDLVKSLGLPKYSGFVSLLDSTSQAVDTVNYGDSSNLITPAYFPGSTGRKNDGADTDLATDFSYSITNSEGAVNNPKKVQANNHLVINEFALAHDACTCVPKSQLCTLGKVDNTSCGLNGQCKQIKRCQTNGRYGACELASPNCIPYSAVPSSTIAAFTWAFNTNPNAGAGGPYIISSCMGNGSCNGNESLPSPTPWNVRWSTSTRERKIDNAAACLNAVISARFSEPMNANSLTTDNIKIFKEDAPSASPSTWTNVTDALVQSINRLSAGESDSPNYFKIVPKAQLMPNSSYLVFVSNNVNDELGRNLVDDTDVNGVRSSNCPSGIAGGVCWQFTTRATGDDASCKVGCINVNPKNYFNRYYGQEKLHAATPISQDNVCLMLNSNDYPWNWSEEGQTTVSGNSSTSWVLQLIDTAYSWVMGAIGGTGIFSQPANTVRTGFATTTAYKESKWQQYDVTNWFKELVDLNYFRITAQETNSQHAGSAPVHNDFTDPIVLENQFCTRSEDPAKQVLQSPSPWKGQQDACINAVIFALFSRDMQNSSLLNGNVAKNFEVYDCGDASIAANRAKATSTDYSVSCGSNLALGSGWTARVFNHAQKNLTMKEIIEAPASAENSLSAEGIRIIPPAGKNLNKNHWYKVVIKGGLTGVRGATTTAELAEGVLQVPSKNAQMLTDTGNSYFWYFKTGAEVCPVDQVAVLPQLTFMQEVGKTQEYEADPIATNCNHLNPFNYTWYWKSLLNPFTNTCIDATGNGVATICSITGTSCATSATNPQPPFVKAFGLSEGRTNVTARAATSTSAGTCETDKWGYGELQIGNVFKVNNVKNTDCLNTELAIDFSADANSASLSANNSVRLFKCTDDECTAKSAESLQPIIFNPAFPAHVNLLPVNNLATGTTYRVVVRGGASGAKSLYGSELAGLNYNSSGGSASGETCDASTDPTNTLLNSVCSSNNCLFNSTANLCNTKFEECNNKLGLLAYYNFDNNYLNQLNSVTSSNFGTSFTAGRYNSAINFASSSKKYVSFSTNILKPQQGTVSLWARPTTLSLGTAKQHLFYAANSANASSDGFGGAQEFHISLGNNAANNVRTFTVFYEDGTSNNTQIDYTENTNIDVTKWYNLVATYQVSSTANVLDLKFYINGQLVGASSTNSFNLAAADFSHIFLGRSRSAAHRFFDGDIDELATYNNVLTGSEVSTLYRNGHPDKVVWGCNQFCQKSGNPTATCGNGKLDDGEQCDDGNKVAGDTCSANCLLEGNSGTCGNGSLDNGQFDSYYYDFKLSNGSKVCQAMAWGLNPCPNGIWSLTADSAVTSLNVTAWQGYQGTNPGGSCILDADMRKLGFWRRIIDQIVKIAKSFFGLTSANAADYWCPISNMDFNSTDLQKMAKGSFDRNDANINAELMAYPDDNNNFKINIIRNTDWATSTEYKFIAVYNKNGIIGTSTANITTFANTDKCQLTDIRFDVWPRGLNKVADVFSCASDPSKGQPDDCGRYSSDLYDDDMSATWTKDIPETDKGYDLHDDANVTSSVNYMPGNQHLYRLWALTPNKYVVRAQFSKLVVANISAETTSSTIAGTGYSGDLWVTSGFKPGKSLLGATAVDPDNRDLGTATGDLPIYTFFCNNPWPNAENFPFVDSNTNCNNSSGCINTNFGTYYCRDAGIDKSCVKGDYQGKECLSNSDCWKIKTGVPENSCQLHTTDDLPSIGDYDSLTGKFGSGMATGNAGDTCQNLPNTFKLGLGYYSYVDSSKYVWDINNTNIYRNPGTGWEKVNKGLWQLSGLPANFRPVFAYSLSVGSVNRDYLWGNADVYYYNGSQWVKDLELKSKLPSGFWPTGGYFWKKGNTVGLFNAAGKIVNINYISSGVIGTATSWMYNDAAIGFDAKPKMYIDYSYDERGPIMLDVNGRIWQYVASTWVKQDVAPLLTSRFNPIWGRQIYGASGATKDVFFGIDPKYYNLTYNSGNNWTSSISPEESYKTCDNKLKEFLFAGIKPIGGDDIYLTGDAAINAISSVNPLLVKAPADKSLTIYNGFGSTPNQSDLIYDVDINKSGNYYVSLETSNNNNSTLVLPVGFNENYVSSTNPGYSHCDQGTNLSGRNVYQKIEVAIDGKNTSTIVALASGPSDRQINRISTPIFIQQSGTHKISLRWLNDCNCFGCQHGSLDSNLRVYSIRVTSANSLGTNDAIGFRVYNNSQHYSAALWYKMQFNPYSQGSLSELNIDGNKAVSEGRTVYVNAPDFGQIGIVGDRNIMRSETTLYSTIYLMSYSENASASTQNIFKQMVNNWFFNAGDHETGGLETSGDIGACSNGSGSANTCITDIDCLKRDTGYCLSTKAKATRDTIRLSDAQDMYVALNSYYSKSRCSNDFTKLCANNSQCFGGGVCGNFYPNLLAGTYITGKSYSVWPSWQDTLAKELGVKLPVDPLNLIFTTTTANAATICSDPYNPSTCWNEKDRIMACNIASSSSFYTYYGTKSGATTVNGTTTSIYVKGELFPYGGKWKPDWSLVTNLRYNPFSGFASQSASQQFCKRITDTCGNGISDSGETCSSCPMDKSCGANQACQNVSGNWTCAPLINCGDGKRQVGEECDGETGCNSCYCAEGYDCSSGQPIAY